jgi:urea carboxylase-associated protein 2
VPPDQVLWDETLGPGDYAARALPRGATLRLTDLDGDACAGMLLSRADAPRERLNVADTLKVQWQAYLGPGSLLLSDMGRVLASIVTDTCGAHDALCGASNERRNAAKYGSGTVHGAYPNARDRFIVALAKFGLGPRDLAPNVNFFKHVLVDGEGNLHFHGDRSFAGALVELRAELELLVVVVNVPHVLDPRSDYLTTPLRVTAWTGEATTRADARWSATPEGERAYLNTEDLLLKSPGS